MVSASFIAHKSHPGLEFFLVEAISVTILSLGQLHALRIEVIVISQSRSLALIVV